MDLRRRLTGAGDLDASTRFLAASYVGKQAKQLARQVKGCRRADDVEYVHRARVASRRLRAALKLFADVFPAKQTKRWRRGIKGLTEGLGAARDRDVQIALVERFLAELEHKACRPGVARLLLRLRQERESLQPEVVEAADRFEAKGILDQLQAATGEVLAELERREVPLRSPSLVDRAEEHIGRRLNTMWAHEHSLRDPHGAAGHHAMRIAGKRLRYTIEICQPVFESRLDEFVVVLKRLQSLLGDVHDCDVWIDQLATFQRNELRRTVAHYGHARPFSRLRAGLEHFSRDRADRRRLVFAQLVDYWDELNRRGAWERLVQTLQSRAEAAVTTAGASPDLSQPSGQTGGRQAVFRAPQG
ncbi:MAG: CHAD domain-containing protein [Planctomycetota bacterium]